jgi:thioredoxin-related protein
MITKKIVLVTTKGCEGCSIMNRHIKEAIENKKDIAYSCKDRDDVGTKYTRTFSIRDFPTVLFFKDDTLIFKYTGSMPTVVINRWIDIYFK